MEGSNCGVKEANKESLGVAISYHCDSMGCSWTRLSIEGRRKVCRGPGYFSGRLETDSKISSPPKSSLLVRKHHIIHPFIFIQDGCKEAQAAVS